MQMHFGLLYDSAKCNLGFGKTGFGEMEMNPFILQTLQQVQYSKHLKFSTQ